MRRRIWFIEFFLLFVIISCIVLPTINAETFKIGKKVSESDPTSTGYAQLLYFNSGVMVETQSDFKDYVPLVLDGNLSTGINKKFGSKHEYMDIELVFPYPYYINNITLKPRFGGNATKGGFWIYVGPNSFSFGAVTSEITFQINGEIKTIHLQLNSNGTNHFYFNDIIINYTIKNTTNNNSNSVLKERVFQLESENLILKKEIENLKNTDIKQKNVIENKSENSVTFGAMSLGILGVVIALIAIALLFKRRKLPTLSTGRVPPPISPSAQSPIEKP